MTIIYIILVKQVVLDLLETMIYCTAGYGCRYGVNCRNAHPDPQVAFFLRKQKESHAAKRFTEQCKHGENCNHPDCTFWHSDAEKAAIKARREAQPFDNFKTALCKFFARGNCTKENCPFAHGKGELRRRRPAAPEGEALADRLSELRV